MFQVEKEWVEGRTASRVGNSQVFVVAVAAAVVVVVVVVEFAVVIVVTTVAVAMRFVAVADSVLRSAKQIMKLSQPAAVLCLLVSLNCRSVPEDQSASEIPTCCCSTTA